MRKSASKLNLKYLFASTEMEWGNLMFINGKDEKSGSVRISKLFKPLYLHESYFNDYNVYLSVVLSYKIFLMTVILR